MEHMDSNDNDEVIETEAETDARAAAQTPALTVSNGGKPRRLVSKNDILAIDDIRRKRVFVEAWNAEVNLRSMTSAENDAFELSQKRDDEGNLLDTTVRARLVAQCLVDDDDNRIFADDEIEILARKSGRALGPLYVECTALNVVGKAAEDNAAKNSGAGPHAGS